jgi:Protein tyrosine and serine/threonine kinase
MFSGKSPFEDVDIYDLKSVLQRGERPSLPADDLSRHRGLNPEMEDLIRDCWTQEPTKRPSADKVVE